MYPLVIMIQLCSFLIITNHSLISCSVKIMRYQGGKKQTIQKVFFFQTNPLWKIFLCPSYFSIKASVGVYKQAYRVHFTEALILRKTQKIPVSLNQQLWILETGHGGFSCASFPIFGQISKGRHSRPDLHFNYIQLYSRSPEQIHF